MATIYRANIQLSQEDIADTQLQDFVSQYIDAQTDTRHEKIDIKHNDDHIIAYKSDQGEMSTTIKLVLSQETRLLSITIRAQVDKGIEFVVQNIPKIILELYSFKPFCIDTKRYLVSLDSPMSISHSVDFTNKCIDIMNGLGEGSMPMVYVSSYVNARPSKYAVDPYRLSKLCLGIACVVIEDDCNMSYKLKDKTDKRRAFDGYIGVYYPHNNVYTHIFRGQGESDKALEYRVLDEVRQWCIKVAERVYPWPRLVALKECQDIVIEKDEINKLVTNIEDDNNKLRQDNKLFREKLYNAEKKLEQLQSRYDELAVAKNKQNSNGGLIVPADIEEFFDEEQYDLVVSALSHYASSWAQNNTRAKELSTALLDKNPLKGDGKSLFDQLTKLFKKSPELNDSVKSKLSQLGFEFESGSTHPKLIYKNNDNYKFTVPSTPSTKNVESYLGTIKQRLNIYCQ